MCGATINSCHEERKTEEFFRLSKDLAGPAIKNRPKPACSEQDFVDHFSAHFGERKLPLPPELDRDDPFIPPRNPGTPEIDVGPPCRTEITAALAQYKNGKARGTDGLFNEQVKYAVDATALVDYLLTFVTLIWSSMALPLLWTQAVISTIYKKGAVALAKNYRPVSMIATLSKILTKLLVRRCRARYEHILSGDQFGFRRNAGTTDAIFCLRQLISKSKLPITALFLDLRGAFDLIDRDHLFRVLEIQLGAEKVVQLFKQYYTATSATIRDVLYWVDLKRPETRIYALLFRRANPITNPHTVPDATHTYRGHVYFLPAYSNYPQVTISPPVY